MDASRRAEIARYAAPVAFLVALTIGVLLVRAAIGGGDRGTTVTALTGLTETTTTARPTTRAGTTSASVSVSVASTAGTLTTEGRFYTIAQGDTLETVALRFAITVDELLELNPGIDPHALRIGQKVRVG